tara:strand:- start:60 stop:479 length:420 start_codon:yes stop_codon:yes gene_type:complete
MGFWSRIGNKVSHAYDVGSRLGMKALGTASRIGHKVSSVGHDVVNTIKASPLGVIAATPLALADRVLGAVDKGTSLADRALGVGRDIDKVVKQTRSHLEKPNIATAGVSAGLQGLPAPAPQGRLGPPRPQPSGRLMSRG